MVPAYFCARALSWCDAAVLGRMLEVDRLCSLCRCIFFVAGLNGTRWTQLVTLPT